MPNITDRNFFYNKVNATKNALIQEWRKDSCFKDKNNFKKSGLIPESIGLTSLLLMMVAFNEDEKVFPLQPDDGDAGFFEFAEVINASFKKIIAWTETGFGAAPLLNRKYSALFDENRGYTETVTWCLSSSVLALYAEDKGRKFLESDVRDGVKELLGKSFKALLAAQRDDGTWGFTTDGQGCRSLYFTYIANASLSDFFDYIMDEINIVEIANGEQAAGSSMQSVIDYLDNYLGFSAVEAAKNAREKLDLFLIESCLPLLPMLARCEEITEGDRKAIGAWKTPAYPDDKAPDRRYYHNLYYTYYILDMMITARADEYFRALADDEEKRTDLLKLYKPYMPQYEQEYYSSETHFQDLFTNFYEQALHSSRMNYMRASRTGETFWDMSTSELRISWEHENTELQKTAATALDQSQANLTDPTILPMALRANTVYSYYVTEKPEITIERLFGDVCDNVYADEIEEDDDEHVQNLWDTVYYNLMITERSIESIVDFYDYINKFDRQDTLSRKTPAVPSSAPQIGQASVSSALDTAVEAKIAEYLRSDAGKAVIAETAANLIPAAAPVKASREEPLTQTQMATQINQLASFISKMGQSKPNGVDDEILATALVKLYEALESLSLKDTLRNWQEDERTIKKLAEDYKKRRGELINELTNDFDDKHMTFAELYDALKSLIASRGL